MSNNNLDNIETILTQIDEMQQTEQGFINRLDIASSVANFNVNNPEIHQLLSDIDNISQAREALFKSVVGKLGVLQDGVSESRVDLVSQLTLLRVVEDRLSKVKAQMSNLKNRNDTKMRLVQVNTYYGKRYERQTLLMKKIIIVCIPLIILFALKKKNIIPELISNYLLGITIAVSSIFIIKDIWEINIRSNMNFDEYEWKYEDPNVYSPSIWEYNKKNFLKMENPFKNLLKNLGICVGDDCCSDGLFFDKKKQKCVVPSEIKPFSKPTSTIESYTNGNGLNGSVVAKYDDEDKDYNGIMPYSAVSNYKSLN